MYEARQNKEKVSRRIDGASGSVRQRKNRNYESKIIQNFKSTDFRINPIKRGSPETYIIEDKYIKKWESDSEHKSSTMESHWKAAKQAEVRVPNYKREKLEDKNEYIFWSKKCKGTTFFQNSKLGHEAKLKKWLSTNKHGTGYLERLRNMFRVANMGDPQGFYEDWQNGAFEFIDIQPMTNNHLMSVYADFIDEIISAR